MSVNRSVPKAKVRTRSTEASGERITRESVVAETNWTVVNDSAVGVHAARIGTWVHASLVRAGTSYGTVGADHALGPAVRWTANVCRRASAYCLVVVHATLTVRSAR